MKKLFITGLLLVTATSFLLAQDINKIINASEVERIEKVLSADDMKGRNTFSPELDKAADFIAAEFKATGLSTLNGADSYLQKFEFLKPVLKSLNYTADDAKIDNKSIIVLTLQEALTVTEQSGYTIEHISKGDNLFQKASDFAQAEKNTIVFVDTPFSKNFGRLIFF